MLKNVFLLIFTSVWLLTGCEDKETALLSRTQVIMGTFATLSLEEKDTGHLQQGFQHLKDLESILSSYQKDADVYQLNQEKQLASNPTLKDILHKSKAYHTQTQGYFDITIGSISKKLYHFGEENETIPSKESLNNAKRNIDAIHITNTKIYTEEDITVDLGGMGKGYAVDKVAKSLSEQNISQGIIALSGDIRCLDVCHFELQSPYSEQTFASLTSRNPQLSISTSGSYRRYIASKKHHHLINPKTASQGRDFDSVSLFTQSNNAQIDAYATAISVMPKEKALKFLREHNEIGFVLIDDQGKILYGNLINLVTIKWLDYKEKATSPSNTINTNINSPIESNLIHPDTITPKMISK